MGNATTKGLWHNECVPPTKPGHTRYTTIAVCYSALAAGACHSAGFLRHSFSTSISSFDT